MELGMGCQFPWPRHWRGPITSARRLWPCRCAVLARRDLRPQRSDSRRIAAGRSRRLPPSTTQGRSPLTAATGSPASATHCDSIRERRSRNPAASRCWDSDLPRSGSSDGAQVQGDRARRADSPDVWRSRQTSMAMLPNRDGHPLPSFVSRRTSRPRLSERRPRNAACLSRPAAVHSKNHSSAPSRRT